MLSLLFFAMDNIDMLLLVKEFVGDRDYICVAPISTLWKESLGDSPKKSNIISHGMSVERLSLAFNTCKIRTKRMSSRSAEIGRLDILKLCIENGCPCDGETYLYAALNGHLDIIKWARKNYYPWDADTCTFAALNGHLDIIKWAHKNGCPWDGETCAYAAMGGHLDLIKWARENGCPWDGETCTSAEKYGHLDVLKWARENGCDEY
jgi:hypothetical protein